jgi:hypothetical protein
MDDPTRRCENDTDKWKRVTRGSCSQARAPFFAQALYIVGQLSQAAHPQQKYLPALINSFRNRNI